MSCYVAYSNLAIGLQSVKNESTPRIDWLYSKTIYGFSIIYVQICWVRIFTLYSVRENILNPQIFFFARIFTVFFIQFVKNILLFQSRNRRQNDCRKTSNSTKVASLFISFWNRLFVRIPLVSDPVPRQLKVCCLLFDAQPRRRISKTRKYYVRFAWIMHLDTCFRSFIASVLTMLSSWRVRSSHGSTYNFYIFYSW